MTKDSDFT